MRSPSDHAGRSEHGFSLIEVVLVVLIMGILASVASQKWSTAIERSRFDATRAEMDRLAHAMTGNPDLTANGFRSDFGYLGDVGALPPHLEALVANPGGMETWRGPYLRGGFSGTTRDFAQDAWGVDYQYGPGLTIVSIGSGDSLTRRLATTLAELTANSVMGSVTDGLNNPPGAHAARVDIVLAVPDGRGQMYTLTTHPTPGGDYVFQDTVPIGNHQVEARYGADTLRRYISVLPGSRGTLDFRFPGTPWLSNGPNYSGHASADRRDD